MYASQSQEVKSGEKFKIVIFNHVHGDGTGDFSHFAGIYKKLMADPLYKDYEFIPIISCAANQCDKIQARIKELPESANLYFLKDGGRLNQSEEKEVQKHLQQAKQIFLISHNLFPFITDYEKYFNPEAPCKFIGEHESEIYSATKIAENCLQPEHYPSLARWQDFSMGLGFKKQGLKLTDTERLSTPEALEQIAKRDAAQPFLTSLFSSTGSDAKTFSENNTLVPVYYNQLVPVKLFLHFLSSHSVITKNPSIYFSGLDLKPENLQEFKDTDSNVNQIQIIRPNQEPEVIDCNVKGKQVIRIFSGFNLDADSYQALYQQGSIAAVSGDNSFEMALSNNMLPFYISTNYAMKYRTLKELGSFIFGLPLKKEVKTAYSEYISVLVRYEGRYNQSLIDLLRKLNAEVIIKHWPGIVNALKKSHNFYDRLQRIFFKDMPLPKLTSEMLQGNDNFPLLCIAIEKGDLDAEEKQPESAEKQCVNKFFESYKPGSNSYWTEERRQNATLEDIIDHATCAHDKFFGGYKGGRTRNTLINVFGITKDQLKNRDMEGIKGKMLASKPNAAAHKIKKEG